MYKLNVRKVTVLWKDILIVHVIVRIVQFMIANLLKMQLQSKYQRRFGEMNIILFTSEILLMVYVLYVAQSLYVLHQDYLNKKDTVIANNVGKN